MPEVQAVGNRNHPGDVFTSLCSSRFPISPRSMQRASRIPRVTSLSVALGIKVRHQCRAMPQTRGFYGGNFGSKAEARESGILCMDMIHAGAANPCYDECPRSWWTRRGVHISSNLACSAAGSRNMWSKDGTKVHARKAALVVIWSLQDQLPSWTEVGLSSVYHPEQGRCVALDAAPSSQGWA